MKKQLKSVHQTKYSVYAFGLNVHQKNGEVTTIHVDVKSKLQKLKKS